MRRVWWAVLLWGWNVQGQGLSSCAGLLDLYSHGAEFTRLLVRNPEAPMPDHHYGTRVAIASYQWQWWMDGKLPEMNFPQAFARAQATITTTDDGTPYRGFSRLALNQQTNYAVVPGQFLHDLVPNWTADWVLSFRWGHELKEYDNEESRRLRAEYVVRRAPDLPPEPTAEFVDAMPFASPVSISFALPRLPDVVVTNDIYEHWVAHHYVSRAEAKQILSVMGEIIEDVKRIRRDAGTTPQSIGTIVGWMAEFLCLGGNAHLFNGGNFSQTMMIVNTTLHNFALRGIPHGHLDYLSMARPFAEVEARFREEVALANEGRVGPAVLAAIRRRAGPTL